MAALRYARLRAAAIWTIPVLLTLLALVPRLWEPDLGPFGERQVAYLEATAARVPDGPMRLIGSPSSPGLALIDPLLRAVGAPLTAWVLLRGLVDAAGVALVFVAVRPVAGVLGAALAAAFYATSPLAVAASRDLAGPFGAVLAAAALLAGLLVARRPTLARGAIFGLLLGLLARTEGPAVLVVAFGATALAFGRASWRIGGITALALLASGGTALVAGLREMLMDPLGGGAGVTAVLSLPAGLLTGLAYRPQDGWPPGVAAPSPLVVVALGAAVAVAVVAGLLAAGLAVRRGERCPVLVAIWPVLAGLAALTGSGPTGVAPSLPPAGAAVMLVPLVAGILALPNAARSPLLRWAGVTLAALLLAAHVTMLLVTGRAVHAAAQEPGVFVPAGRPARQLATASEPGRALGTAATLRDWLALSATTRDVTERVGVTEFVVLPGSPLAGRVDWLRRLGGPASSAREVSATMVLPIERETVYLVSEPAADPAASAWLVDLQRPASRTAVVTAGGIDTGALLVTLRPRPAEDWLARVRAVDDGRFVDGSRIIGIQAEATTADTLAVALYWELPAAADGRSLGVRVRAAEGRGDDDGEGSPSAEVPLPDVGSRRAGEIIVSGLHVPVSAGSSVGASLLVQLVDRDGRAIRSVDGGEVLELLPSRIPASVQR